MITSGNNSRVKRVVQLNEKARYRKAEDAYVAEGIKMFLEAPEDRIGEVYLSEGFQEERCMERLARLRFERVSEEVFRKMSDTPSPQGILCVMRKQHYNIEEILQKKNPLLILLEDLQDPGNLGTIIRTAEGAGIDGVIMSKGTVDLYNPKTIRSTMGSIYRIPFIYTCDLCETITRLREMGIKVFAAHLKGSVPYDEADYTGGSAILVGNEANGLQEETARRADLPVRIPMEGQVESLNAAVASAVLMYEAARQRREHR